MVLGAVVMMFAALSSVYIALSGNDQWQPVQLPRVLILSTGIIWRAASPLAWRGDLEAGKRIRPSLLTTLVLGLFHWVAVIRLAASFTYPAAT
jgi:hypothetical protein